MTDRLLLDVDAARDLFEGLHLPAGHLTGDRAALHPLLADAERMLGPIADPASELRATAELLLELADDLDNRLRMVAFGGPDLNRALWAIERLRDGWNTIDNRAGSGGSRDGIVSDDDLEWAAENLTGDTAAAVRWLLDHPDIFRALETAAHHTDYLRAEGPVIRTSGGDAKLSLADVDAWIHQLDAWATLLPYMPAIDVARHGGDVDGTLSKADFEAFLDDARLPADVRAAAQAVLDDEAFHATGEGVLSWNNVLLVASMIPVVGDVLDGTMALYYLSQGRWTDAAMSGIGLIPVPGVSGGSARAAREGVEEIGETLAPRAAREADYEPPSPAGR